ncbi:hypothetical protein, partial [Roseicella aerolata]
QARKEATTHLTEAENPELPATTRVKSSWQSRVSSQWQSTPRDKAGLKAGLTSYMRGLQRRPAKVRAFFQATTVRYAA